MKKDECQTCRFFEHCTSQYGKCHKNAPIVSPDNSEAQWPTLSPNDFCGDHENNPEHGEEPKIVSCVIHTDGGMVAVLDKDGDLIPTAWANFKKWFTVSLGLDTGETIEIKAACPFTITRTEKARANL